MAITARTTTKGTAASNASFTITLPTGTTDGDVILLGVANAGTSGPSAPTGWSAITGSPFSAGSSQSISIFKAKYTASLTLTFTNAASAAAWACWSASGANTAAIVDTQAAANNTTNNTTLPTGNPTTGSVAGDYEILFYVWTSAATISATAAGSTIDNTQANSTSVSIAVGHNNTTSLGASTATTAFSHTLSASNTRKTGVGVLVLAAAAASQTLALATATSAELAVTASIGAAAALQTASAVMLSVTVSIECAMGLMATAAGVTTRANDTFTDTDGTSLASHTGEVGSPWTSVFQTGDADIVIQGNRAAFGGTFGDIEYEPTGQPSSDDLTVEFDLYANAGVSDGADSLVIVLRQDGSGNQYGLWYIGGSEEVWVMRYGGTDISPGTNITFQHFTIGNTYHVITSVVGDHLVASVDGVTICDVHDSNIASSGLAHIYYQRSGTPVDNYRIDNFQVYEGSGAGAVLLPLDSPNIDAPTAQKMTAAVAMLDITVTGATTTGDTSETMALATASAVELAATASIAANQDLATAAAAGLAITVSPNAAMALETASAQQLTATASIDLLMGLSTATAAMLAIAAPPLTVSMALQTASAAELAITAALDANLAMETASAAELAATAGVGVILTTETASATVLGATASIDLRMGLATADAALLSADAPALSQTMATETAAAIVLAPTATIDVSMAPITAAAAFLDITYSAAISGDDDESMQAATASAAMPSAALSLNANLGKATATTQQLALTVIGDTSGISIGRVRGTLTLDEPMFSGVIILGDPAFAGGLVVDAPVHAAGLVLAGV